MSTACSHAVPDPVRYPVLPTRVSAEQQTSLYEAYRLVCDSGACRQGETEAPLAAFAAGAYGGAHEVYEQDQSTRRKVRWGSVGAVSVVGGAGLLFLGLSMSARSTAQTLRSAGLSDAEQRADADRYQLIAISGLAGALVLGAVAGLVQAFWGTPDEAFEAEYNRELAQALDQRR